MAVEQSVTPIELRFLKLMRTMELATGYPPRTRALYAVGHGTMSHSQMVKHIQSLVRKGFVTDTGSMYDNMPRYRLVSHRMPDEPSFRPSGTRVPYRGRINTDAISAANRTQHA